VACGRFGHRSILSDINGDIFRAEAFLIEKEKLKDKAKEKEKKKKKRKRKKGKRKEKEGKGREKEKRFQTFRVPVLGWEPRPLKRPGGSMRKLPTFSFLPSTVA
jgi:transposase